MECDSQIVAEATVFLDKDFDNSFMVQTLLEDVKSYAKEWEQISRTEGKQHSRNTHFATQDCSQRSETGQISASLNFHKDLKLWGLPHEITSKYEQKGIKTMFEWQVACLSNSKVLLEFKNLVYSAPTSAGKTLVAELLAIKNVLERHKKVIFILPFVSVVREKMFYFQEIFGGAGVRVEGFMGSHAPPGGFQSVHIAICTIEKANSLVNKLMDEGNMSELGAIIVDEIHLLGDASRGYILELLLTKIKYLCRKLEDVQIQIIGMSATLPNLNLLTKWLDAELFVTQFRPIPLEECCLIKNQILDRDLKSVREIKPCEEVQNDILLQICLETIQEDCSVLIFCTSKNWCENLAQSISSQFYKVGSLNSEAGNILRNQLKSDKILEVLGQLKNSPVGLDTILKGTISFGVAYHHAGLTFDERDIIEGAFKSGAIRVLVATSTLSSGVNLPARRVIIRSPVFQRQPLNILTYKQMIGRAGRMGKDSKGESILMCAESESQIAHSLMTGELAPVESCLEGGDKFMRAILEVIASQVASIKEDLKIYTSCTLLYNQKTLDECNSNLLNDALLKLVDYELVRTQENDNDAELFVATPLGKACLSSSMAPDDGLTLFCELQKARRCLVLENDLHLIYLVTPYSVSNQWADMDWMHLLNLWESLTNSMKRVGELVGVQESFMIQCIRGNMKINSKNNKAQIHKRFYTALALQDLVSEVPLSAVASKFRCCRGMLQSLQQSAATFAGMVTAFCRQLGWKNVEMLVAQFQDRLHFGIQSELLDLMKLNSLNGMRARSLFNAGIESVCLLATADINSVENALLIAVPFQSEKGVEGDDVRDVSKGNTQRNIWITGNKGMTAKEAADKLIREARCYLQLEIGVDEIRWTEKNHACKETEDDSTVETHVDTVDVINGHDSTVKIDAANISENDIKLSKYETSSQKNNENLVDNNENEISHDLIINDQPLTENLWDTLDLSELREKSFNAIEKCKADFSTPVASSVNKTTNETFLDSSWKQGSKSGDSSLFSTEEAQSPNLFEESLSINSQISKLINEKNQISKLTINNTNDEHLSEFSSFDVEEEIKLHYDEDEVDQSPPNEFDEQIPSSQNTNSFSSFVNHSNYKMKKRKAKTIEDKLEMKRLRYIPREFWQSYKNKIVIEIPQKDKTLHRIEYIVVESEKTTEALDYISKLERVSFYIELEEIIKEKTLIGSNIVKSNNENITKCNKFSLNPYNNRIVKAFAFGVANSVLYFEFQTYINMVSFRQKIQSIFENVSEIILRSYKMNYLYLKSCGVDIMSNCYDVAIGHWSIDSYSHKDLADVLEASYLDFDLDEATLVNGDGSWKRRDTSCLRAWAYNQIAVKQTQLMEQCFSNPRPQFLEIEHKVSKILADSELAGIKVDKELSSKLSVDVKSCQNALQQQAYALAGHRFSFSSSKAVAKALGLYKGRKISTKKSVLAGHNTKLASIIIYWRKLEAITTKTLSPLNCCLQFKSSDERIHVNYSTETQTGRITMHEPNIQNVPRNFSIPAELLDASAQTSGDVMEFSCRNIFVASPGWIFVAADYCQLEMRILTHLSGDETLTNIMSSDIDVFKSIAASWNSVPEDCVDDDLRQRAKQLCYGIIYGIGAKSLSEQLDVSVLEASVFMDTFNAAYPSIGRYKSKVVAECREKGFVQTLKGRRRYLSNINHIKSSERNAAERQAFNTAIQGSAADIAKLAMVNIDDIVNRNNQQSNIKLLLQMHDELIYEVKETEKELFVGMIKQGMEKSVTLNVPLPVKVRCGKRWGTLAEI